jgi:rhodanese-related sulfurtransferase
MERLLFKPSQYLNENETYYIYCSTGTASEDVCKSLTSNYHVIQVIGGYDEWLSLRKKK